MYKKLTPQQHLINVQNVSAHFAVEIYQLLRPARRLAEYNALLTATLVTLAVITMSVIMACNIYIATAEPVGKCKFY